MVLGQDVPGQDGMPSPPTTQSHSGVASGSRRILEHDPLFNYPAFSRYSTGVLRTSAEYCYVNCFAWRMVYMCCAGGACTSKCWNLLCKSIAAWLLCCFTLVRSAIPHPCSLILGPSTSEKVLCNSNPVKVCKFLLATH